MKKSETSPFLCNYLIKCTAILRSKRPDIEARWSSKYQIVASPTCKNYFVAHLYGREISLRYGLDSILSLFSRTGNYPWPLFYDWSESKAKMTSWSLQILTPDGGQIQIVKLPSQFYATLDRLIGRKLFICWSVLGSPRKIALSKREEK